MFQDKGRNLPFTLTCESPSRAVFLLRQRGTLTGEESKGEKGNNTRKIFTKKSEMGVNRTGALVGRSHGVAALWDIG
jgi:hypothetical protein